MAPRYSQKWFSIWHPSAILNLKKIDFFSSTPSSEWKYAATDQIWLKSDNFRPRYGDDAIFKMSAKIISHLEFSKIAVLVTWPVLPGDSVFPIQISHLSVNMAPIYSQKRFSIWRPSAVLNFKIFEFLLIRHHDNWNVHLLTKLDQNRIILSWDMEIMLFSKWRPSAILNLRKLHFLSRDIYRHVILHVYSKFCVDRPLWCQNIPKHDFQYGVRPPSWICYDVIILHRKTAFYVLNFVLNFHRLRFHIF